MATYNPPEFPRRPKQSTPWSEVRYQLQLNYYRYEINTALYVMSPGEKLAYNTIVLSFLVLCVSAIYYYLPSCVHLFVDRLACFFIGGNQLHISTIEAAVQGSQHTLGSIADEITRLNSSSTLAL